MGIVAFHNYVIAQIDTPEEQTVGKFGVIVPSVRTTTFPVIGTIVAVGKDVKAPGLAEGVKILFPPYGLGHRHTIEGKKYVTLLDHEVLGFFA